MRGSSAFAVAAGAVVAATVAVVLVAGSDGGAVKGARAPPPPGGRRRSAPSLARAVTVRGLVEHLRALQRIADAAGGTRAAGGPSDRASERYVAARLRAAGWRVRLQPVSFPYSAQRRPPRLEADGREIETTALRFSASGSVHAPLALGGSGCLATDYEGFLGARWRSFAAAGASCARSCSRRSRPARRR